MRLVASLVNKLRWVSWLRPFRHWFPASALVVGSVLWSFDIAYWGDFGLFLILFLVYPLTVLVMVVVAAINWRHWRCSLSTLLIFFLLSWLVASKGYAAHLEVRWLTGSAKYKSELLAGPPTPASELRHMEWDGWGMAGQDTSVYLVYDPQNSLASAARHNLSGKVSGIPCGVSGVGRLQDHWYYAVLYTNTFWEWCGDDR